MKKFLFHWKEHEKLVQKEKGHNLYLKMHIPRDIKVIRQNDVINDDVIENKKLSKFKFFWLIREKTFQGTL